MIKPWLFEFFHSVHDPAGHDDPETVHEHYRAYFDLWIGDEARGFEGIFFSEHHFGPGYSPSPNLLISHLAARTSTMRLGVLGSVSAYSTPWRVAEEFAMLDHLTNGRLEMGVVSGIPPSSRSRVSRHRRQRRCMPKCSTCCRPPSPSRWSPTTAPTSPSRSCG